MFEPKPGELSEQFLLTIIGLTAAFIGWIVNQLVLRRWDNFRQENRMIALERLEKAYQPLYYLTGILLQKLSNDEDVTDTKQRIGEILEKHGHLLSPEIESMTIAYLFMKSPEVAVLEKERLNLAMELETLKNLVYPSYKTYAEYYTSSIFGKMKIFWFAVQYRLFSTIVTLLVLFLLGYMALVNLNSLLIVAIVYVVIGSVIYIYKDHSRSKRLRSAASKQMKVHKN